MVNAEQTEQWNGETGQFWAEHEDHFDAMLSPLTTHLVAAAAVGSADRVLDVGCGCGATTRMVAEQASAGTVLGVDLSEPMLARARQQVADAGLRNARFERGDAQVHDFAEDAFDLVISRFGMMFFDDPPAAFSNLTLALRPGGRIVFLCWQELARNEQRVVPLNAIAAHVPVPDVGNQDAPGPFSLADPARVRDLLVGAGLCDIVAASVTEPVVVGANASEAAEFARHLPTIRSLLAAADETAAAAAVAAVREALVPYETPAGVLLGSAAWLVTARRPLDCVAAGLAFEPRTPYVVR